MAEVPASVVVKLRKMSGQGMMDCKKALEESNGDMDKAMEILRKKGLATLARRAERETTEGAVVSWQSQDGKEAALATLCCETDFVAKSDDFVQLARDIRDYIGSTTGTQGAESVLQTIIAGRTFQEVLTEVVSKTGEKMQVGDYARFRLEGPGIIGTYIHFNNKVGSMVQIDTSDAKVAQAPSVKQAAADIAMHITASKPIALDVASLDPQVVEREKAIYAAQVQNKPPAGRGPHRRRQVEEVLQRLLPAGAAVREGRHQDGAADARRSGQAGRRPGDVSSSLSGSRSDDLNR